MPHPIVEQPCAPCRPEVRRKLPSLFIFMLVWIAGCSHNSPASTENLLIVVPGAGGFGFGSGMIKGLRDGGVDDVDVFKWGSHVFLLNLQDPVIHLKAETALAARLASHFKQYPDARIDLLGHSAGCGVILGALARIDPDLHVNTVVLLAPSVSPTYNLLPALKRIAGTLHNFHSTRDKLWLSWRVSTFGTYDNIKTKAAGNTGFTNLDRLPPPLQQKVIQHPYDRAWRDLGNDGDHMGPTSRKFAEEMLAPLLNKS
jgi:pimeloyl-ACP methyl ester carboxylesterase